MAVVTRVHPVTSAINVEVAGNLQFFTITYPGAVNAKTGPESTQEAVKRAIGDLATILAIGPLGNSNTERTYMVRADALDTISSTTTVAAIQAAVRALNALTPDKVTATISSATAGDRDMSDTQVA